VGPGVLAARVVGPVDQPRLLALYLVLRERVKRAACLFRTVPLFSVQDCNMGYVEISCSLCRPGRERMGKYD
jgi:hypothetical protein